MAGEEDVEGGDDAEDDAKTRARERLSSRACVCSMLVLWVLLWVGVCLRARGLVAKWRRRRSEEKGRAGCSLGCCGRGGEGTRRGDWPHPPHDRRPCGLRPRLAWWRPTVQGLDKSSTTSVEKLRRGGAAKCDINTV